MPTKVLPYEQVVEKVNTLISGVVTELITDTGCQTKAIEALNSLSELFQNYAHNFMQVRIEPVIMKVDGKDMSFTVPEYTDVQYKYCGYERDTIFIVHSPVHISGLECIANLLHRLQIKFKSMLLQECGKFCDEDCLKYSAEIKYIKKACHVLVHKMFDKSAYLSNILL